MAIQMLNRRFVPPSDLVDRHVEHAGDLLALRGAWRPAAKDDGQRAAFFQPATLGELADVQMVIAAQVSDSLGHRRRGAGSQKRGVRKPSVLDYIATYGLIYQRVAPCRCGIAEKVWRRTQNCIGY